MNACHHIARQVYSGPPRATRARASLGDLLRRPETGALIGTISVFVFFAIFGGAKFLAAGGAASWLNVAAELGIIAIPVGLLMIAGELDLSVGSVLASSSMTMAIVSGHWGAPIDPRASSLALALGLATGFLNGLLVTRTKVPSFVVTLATNFGLAGLALGLTRVITGTTSVAIKPEPWRSSCSARWSSASSRWPSSGGSGWSLVVGWMLHVSPYGNWIFAVGGDKDSARATGIPVSGVKIAPVHGQRRSARPWSA